MLIELMKTTDLLLALFVSFEFNCSMEILKNNIGIFSSNARSNKKIFQFVIFVYIK